MQYTALSSLLLCWIVSVHFPPWATFHSEVPAVVAALFGLVACHQWSRGVVRLPMVACFIGVAIAIALAQLALGQIAYGSDVLLMAVYAIAFGAAWLWGSQWVGQGHIEQLTNILTIFAVIMGLVTAFQTLVQWFHLEADFAGWVLDGLSDDRPRANIGQPNHVATSLLMASVGAFSLRYRQRIGRFVLWLVLFLFGFAVVLTRSRTALVSAILITIMYCILSGRTKRLTLRPIEAIIWLFLILGMTWCLPYLNSFFTDGSVSTIGELGSIPAQLTTPGARTLVWRQMAEAISLRPWFGWGWLQIPAAHQAAALVIPADIQLTYSHNIVLDACAMLGIPLACLALGISVFWFLRRVNLIFKSTLASTALFMMIPLVVHMQLEYPHAYAYFVVFAGLLFGVIDGSVEMRPVSVFMISRKILLVFTFAWGLVLVAIAYEYMLVEEDFRINRFENRNIGKTPDDYKPPKLILLSQLSDMLRGMRLRAEPGMSQEDLNVLVKISKRYSWAQMQFRTALALGLNGRSDEATEQLRVIKTLFAEDVYEEAKENWDRLAKEKYPELRNVVFP